MKPATLFAAVAALLLLTACSSTPSLEARTDYNREFDFSGVNSIAIQPVQRANQARSCLRSPLHSSARQARARQSARRPSS